MRHDARGARNPGISNFCACSVYYFSCYPVESTKTIACVHWNILMPAPTFAARAERVLLVAGAGINYIYKLRFRYTFRKEILFCFMNMTIYLYDNCKTYFILDEVIYSTSSFVDSLDDMSFIFFLFLLHFNHYYYFLNNIH